MIAPDPSAATVTDAPVADDYPKPTRVVPPMPRWWRFAILGGVVAVTVAAYLIHPQIGTRGQAACGILCFLAVAAAFSRNLRAVNWKTFGIGVALQVALVLAVTQVPFVRSAFELVGAGIGELVKASDKGAEFVFGDLARSQPPPDEKLSAVGGGMVYAAESQRQPPIPFHFAFKALPPIIFVSAFFSVLYYFGILQFFVRIFAKVMMFLLGTSGAETLSVAANVFMGQTEAPLIVKPFVPRMTESELLTLMASGMAHISGGMMAVYISYGADPVSILCTCVMACPCSLYLSKLVLPELAVPTTLGDARIQTATSAVNPIDAASNGVKDGLFLALNVAAMLIGFLAFIALFDSVLVNLKPWMLAARISPESLAWWPDDLSLGWIFGRLFSPVAFLMGVPPDECRTVGGLLGTKLAANEHVAYLGLKKLHADGGITDRSHKLAVYALTGFANFSSVGIQLGGIGAMAPGRRHDLARLGMKALFVGFLVTLINAAVAGLLLGD